MSVITGVRKTGESLLATGRKPFYLSAGAADLAAERARTLGTEAKKAKGSVQDQLKSLPGTVKTLPTTVQAQIKALPGTVQTQVKGLPGQVSALSDRASTLANDLVVRGEKLVGSIRNQATTQTAAKQTTSAVRKTKAASTSARKATSAVGKAVEDAADKIG